MYFVLLFPLAYLLFVFIAEDFNPIIVTKNPMKRRRWRLGRAAALATIVAGVCTLVFMQMLSWHPRLATGCFLGLTMLFVLPSVVKYKKAQVWQ